MVILQPLYLTPAEARLCCPLVAKWENETYQLSVGKELRQNILCRYACMLTLDRHINDAFILDLLDMKTYHTTVNT